MKIMYIIDTHPENGGAPISTCSIAEEISKTHEVYLVLPSQKREYERKGSIKYIEVNGFGETFPSLIFDPLKTIRLAKIIRKELLNINPDVVHIHMPRAAWATGLLQIFHLIPRNFKFIYTDREHMESYRWPLKILNLVLIKCNYDRIICLTKLNQTYWDRFPGKARISTIPNFAGRKYEEYSEEFRRLIRNKYYMNDNILTVMFSGRMNKHKNWGLAKKIILKLINSGTGFIIAISTTDKDQLEEYNLFKSEIEEVTKKCLFFHNANQSEMAELYYLADIFILTSNKESFGRTAIEAMSRKCVVIGRDVGGLSEVINMKENILNEDELEFSNRVYYYMGNFETLKEHKKWFFERFIECYTLERNIDMHLELYSQTINKKY